MPLSESDAAHPDRATITPVSVEGVTRARPSGIWRIDLTIEISATTPTLVQALARGCWAYLFEESRNLAWVTRSNGRDLWLNVSQEWPIGLGFGFGFDPEFKLLKRDQVTQAASGRYTATISASIASHDEPSGVLTIAFNPDGWLEMLGSMGPTIPEGGIDCPAATLLAPVPSETTPSLPVTRSRDHSRPSRTLRTAHAAP